MLTGTAYPTTEGNNGDWYLYSPEAGYGRAILIGPKASGAWPTNQGRAVLPSTSGPWLANGNGAVSSPGGSRNSAVLGVTALPGTYLGGACTVTIPAWTTQTNITRDGSGLRLNSSGSEGYLHNRTGSNDGYSGNSADTLLQTFSAVVTTLPTTASKYIGIGYGNPGSTAGYFVGTNSAGALTIFRLAADANAPTVMAQNSSNTVAAGDQLHLIRTGRVLTAYSTAGTTVHSTTTAFITAGTYDNVYSTGPTVFFQAGDTVGRLKTLETNT